MRYRVPKFLSHVAYKKWAEDHGDVFSVEVKITLHVEEKNPEPEWETISKKRYRYVSSVNINEFILLFLKIMLLHMFMGLKLVAWAGICFW